MATSIAVQSVIASQLNRTHLANSNFGSKYAPSLRRNLRMPVRCRLQEDDKDDLVSRLTPPTSLKGGEEDGSVLPKLNPPPSNKEVGDDESPLSSVTPHSSTKVKPTFIDIFSFTGPGPERINGRLAMIGFVSAMVVEITRGQDLFTQIGNGGYMWFFWTSVLFTVASLIPFLRGMGPGATSDRFWNPDAEVWNGRAAMVGLVALAITEYIKGGALI